MIKTLAAALVAATALASTASAALLGGTFNVTAVNATGMSSANSEATMANFLAAVGTSDKFTYTGDLNFGTFGGPTTIEDWLATGSGVVGGLDIGALTLSSPDINNGTATTTFFLFELLSPLSAGSFSVDHDDGMSIYQDGAFLGGFNGPNVQRNTGVAGFTGGAFSILYVATNGDPSVLRVDTDAQVVPLPATLPLILAGMGGLFAIGRRARK